MKLRLAGWLLMLALLTPQVWAEPEAAPADAEESAEEGESGVVYSKTQPLPKAVKAPRKLPGGWTLDWNDEFNGNKLDEKKWNYELGVIRNKGCSQAYTKDCVKVKNGALQLISVAKETRNETYGKPGVAAWAAQIRTQPFASGSVTTRGTVLFTPPGRLEFRARVPKAKGVWPAVWTMHRNAYHWPANGEIDILEHISSEPNKVHHIFRWGENGTEKEFKVLRGTQIPDFSKEFHVYVMEWEKDYMSISVDGQEAGRVNIAQAKYPNGDNPLLTPCYLIMNTAIGGTGTWAPKADPSQYPVVFEIDYVRFYKKDGGGVVAASSAASEPKKKAKKKK